ncbi:MAG TPA: gamma-glutamyl-gamma-aminobutyrate hydrolase family protein [Candidatus Acidoferrum sp.]|nr:gamma-glutamyl-gamma-aminobutyrate hydrolase family protein [Candidatus Acidoferrum sp.]
MRIGIPWRTSAEESAQDRPRIQNYEDAVHRAGGEPVLLSLRDAPGTRPKLAELDGFVLPGSPADVETTEYGAKNSGLSLPADLARERTDRAILEHTFREKKPVLAICYGCQLLNVYLGGTLIQDLRSETGTKVAHRRKDVSPEAKVDPEHVVNLQAGSLLADLAGGSTAVVNSSHHQAVKEPGRGLKVTGVSATDGIVEGLEWTGDANWVVGVQWHPERMKGDALAERLFSELVAAAEASKSNEKATAKR